MTKQLRFRKWSELSASSRARKQAGTRAYARALEPRLHAFVAFTSMPPCSGGALDGMPYAAKDIFWMDGRRPFGGRATELPYSEPSRAEVLHRLDTSGGFCIGYAAMTELAYEPSGYNALGGAKNPWNPDFITGGSSSGSAVAVASGSVIMALGSDTGGSLRIPAHACGVTAWKPTTGVVPASGTMALAPTLDSIGLIARSAEDMHAAARVLMAIPDPASEVPRSAVVLSDVLSATECSVSSACREGIDAVAACGLALIRRDGLSAIDALDAAVFTIMQAEAAHVHQGLMADARLDPALRKRLEKGLKIDDRALRDAVSGRASQCTNFLDQIFGAADVIVLPILPIRTPAVTVCDPTSPKFEAKTLYQLSRWTRFVNLLGLPGLALPIGFDDRGMPVGMQIVGRPHSDLALIALGIAIQSKTDWHALVPSGVKDLALAMCADEVS
jgi:aspartyl-tRNA(Asn)/glutamyl-tRNA(Gln) amidotransferase subunit A